VQSGIFHSAQNGAVILKHVKLLVWRLDSVLLNLRKEGQLNKNCVLWVLTVMFR